MKSWSLEKSLLEPRKGLSTGRGSSSCRELRAASYRGEQVEKKGILERRKPDIARNDEISSLVEGTARDSVSFYLSKVIAF